MIRLNFDSKFFSSKMSYSRKIFLDNSSSPWKWKRLKVPVYIKCFELAQDSPPRTHPPSYYYPICQAIKLRKLISCECLNFLMHRRIDKEDRRKANISLPANVKCLQTLLNLPLYLHGKCKQISFS